MAELKQQENLQPALLDRLTDDSPSKKTSRSGRSVAGRVTGNDPIPRHSISKADKTPVTAEKSHGPTSSAGIPVYQVNPLVISSRRLKEYVKRDLSWLLNTVNLEALVDLEPFPRVKRSVLNYGVFELTGTSVNNINTLVLAKKITEIILCYEPRIIEDSLSVNISKQEEMTNRAIRFDIECDIWAQPVPEHVHMNSEFDLTTGSFNFTDSA